MRSLRTAQDSADTVRRCSRSLLLACHCCSRPPPPALPVPQAVRLCHSRGPVIHLPDSLRSVRDHFLSLDPTSLTVDLLEQHLLAAETSVIVVGAARGTPRTPFFEGCSPSPLAPSYASAAAVDVLSTEDVGAASASAKHHSSKGKGGRGGRGGSGSGGGGSSGGSGGSGGGGSGGSGGGSGGVGSSSGGSGGSGGSGSGGSGGGRTGAERGGSGGGQPQWQQRRSETPSPEQLREWLFQRGASGGSVSCPYVIRTGDHAGQTCGKVHTHHRCFSRLDDAWRAEFGDKVERPHWAELLRSGVEIFSLDYDVILSAMYALSDSAEGDCYRCVPADPGIDTAALDASESVLPGTAPAEALHTFTLDSGASRCFSCDSTTLTPLHAPVPVRLADLSGGPVVARSSTVLPCLAVLSGSLSGLHLPSFSTNLVSTVALQDVLVTTTTPGGQHVSICTCTRTGRHLTTFTRRPRSSSTPLLVSPPDAPDSSVAPPPEHPSLSCLRGMHSRLLVFGLPRSLPPLPPSPAPPCLPCVEGRQRAAPHSSFPPTAADLQTLHIDMWGPARVSGQGRERYFLLVVDDYTRYTMVFPLRSKGEVVDVLIPWIRAVRLQLRERFRADLPVLRLHSDRGGEFSSDLLRDFSPHWLSHGGRSYLHDPCGCSQFLWPFAVQYAAHQLNLWPCVSLPETSPTLSLTGKVGDASVFRVWGSRAFVRDTSADKLSARAIVPLSFTPDVPCWQFYHPTSHRVFPSQDVTFDESVPFYRFFPYRSAPPPPPPLFLAPCPPPVDPLPPQGPAPSRVSRVDPLSGNALVEVAIGSGAARGAAPWVASGGAEPGVAESEGAGSGGPEPGGEEPRGAEPAGVEPGGAEPEGVEPVGAVSEGAEFGGAEPQGAASSGGPAGASPRLSPQQLRDWLVRHARLWSGANGPGGAGAAGAGGAGVTAGAGGTGGTDATSPGGARTRGTGAAGTGGAGGDAVGDPMEPRAAGAGGSGSGGSGAGGARAGGTGAGGAGAGGAGVGGTGEGGAGAGGTDAGGAGSQLPLQPASLLPAPSPYSEQTGGLTERGEHASRPVLHVLHCSSRSLFPSSSCPRHTRYGTSSFLYSTACSSASSSVSSLPEVPVPEFDHARAAGPTVSRLLATAVTDPSFDSSVASALVAELLDFAAACRLDNATALVAESESASPPSVEGECALGTDVLEDRQEYFECLATTVPRFASMLLAPEGDPDAPNVPTPRSYAEANTGPYSSQWNAAMDAEMASWKSTGTYVDEVPPPRANIVDGMWIFRVKRPPGSRPAFKAHYVARGFSQRQRVDYFQTFSPTPKMTTLWVLLHVAAQRDYELHSLDFSTAFLQGSLHEEIWLRRPPGFTRSFPSGTQWSLRRPVYGLRQAPREWHDTLRTTLAALGFSPSTADPSLFLRTDTSLPPFYILVYVDDLVFASADTEALTLVKSEVQKRYTISDLGELRSYLGLQITQNRARRTITLSQSHMVHQVLQHFNIQFSSPQPTPLSTSHSLSAPHLDKSIEPTGPYPELVGCLMYLMTCTRPDLVYPLSLLARYVAPGRHRKVHWDAAKRVLRYLCSTSGMGLVLGGRGPVVLTGHAAAFLVDDSATQRSSQGYTFSLGAIAAQELRWLTYLLTDLGKQPRSPPVLYVDHKAMIALCQEHRLEHRTKHIAL
ncbi:unnamed protein product [Closterium sp. NIES-54]